MAPVTSLAQTPDTEIDPITGQPKKATTQPAPSGAAGLAGTAQPQTQPQTQTQQPAAQPAASTTQYSMLNPNDPNAMVKYDPAKATPAPALPQTQGPAVTMSEQTAKGREDVIGALQRKAIAGTESPLAGLVQSQTQEYMTNPQYGFDPEEYKRSRLAEFDLQRAKAFQAAKEQVAPITGSGVVQQGLLGNVLEGAAQRQSLERELASEGQQRAMDIARSRLAEGRTTAEQQSQTLSRDIGNLATATGATEGEAARAAGSAEAAANRTQEVLLKGMDQAGQERLTRIAADIDTAKWIRQSDWEATQKDIDRQIMQAESAGDRALARELEYYKGDLQLKVQEKQQQFQKDMAAYDRDTQTTLQGLQQAFEKGMLYDRDKLETVRQQVQNAHDLAMQSNDINAQLEAIQAKGRIDSQLKQMDIDYQNQAALRDRGWFTQDKISDQEFTKLMNQIKFDQESALEKGRQAFQTEFATIEADLAEARAQKDFGRETELLGKKAEYEAKANEIAFERTKELEDVRQKWELKKLTEGQTFEQSQTLLKSQLAEATANNDVERQRRIIEYQGTQRLAEMARQGELDKELQRMNTEAQALRDAGNYRHAEAMQRSAQEFEAQQAAQQRAMQKLGITEAFVRQYGSQDDIKQFVEKTLGQGGMITIKNATQAAKEAAKMQYDSAKYMWLSSHTTDNTLVDQATGELTAAGEKNFADYWNKQYTSPEAKTAQDKIADSVEMANKDNVPEAKKKYDEAFSKAYDYDPTKSKAGTWKRNWKPDKATIDFENSPPAVGTFIKMGGKLYQVASPVLLKNEVQQFNVLDPDTQTTKTVYAGSGFKTSQEAAIEAESANRNSTPEYNSPA